MSSGPIDIESRTDNPSSGLVLGRPHLTGELNADKTRGIVHVAFQTESSRDNRHWNRGPCFLSHPDRVFLPSGGKESTYYAGLVMIVMASLSMLVRGWFFPNASPDPRTIGGLLRLARGLLVLA